MEITSNTQKYILPQQILRGKDLKDYRIIPNFELKEKIIRDKKESAKTNLLQKPLNLERSSLIKLS